MHRIHKSTMLFLLIVTITLSACDSDKSPDSLQGTWKLIRFTPVGGWYSGTPMTIYFDGYGFCKAFHADTLKLQAQYKIRNDSSSFSLHFYNFNPTDSLDNYSLICQTIFVSVEEFTYGCSILKGVRDTLIINSQDWIDVDSRWFLKIH